MFIDVQVKDTMYYTILSMICISKYKPLKKSIPPNRPKNKYHVMSTLCFHLQHELKDDSECVRLVVLHSRSCFRPAQTSPMALQETSMLCLFARVWTLFKSLDQ